MPKDNNFYIADVTEPFEYKVSFRINERKTMSASIGEVLYILRSYLSSGKGWIVYKDPTSKTGGWVEELLLLDKIKVRRPKNK